MLGNLDSSLETAGFKRDHVYSIHYLIHLPVEALCTPLKQQGYSVYLYVPASVLCVPLCTLSGTLCTLCTPRGTLCTPPYPPRYSVYPSVHSAVLCVPSVVRTLCPWCPATPFLRLAAGWIRCDRCTAAGVDWAGSACIVI